MPGYWVVNVEVVHADASRGSFSRSGKESLEQPPRRWKCNYCPAHGTIEELQKIACTHVYPPCDFCGLTPECAQDCRGVALALAGDDVHVIAGPPKGNA